MPEKQCRKCKAIKPISDFCKRRETKDGCASWCKTCTQAHNNRLSEKSRRPHADKFLEVATEWNRKYPVKRSDDYDTRVSILKGDSVRTVSI
jgi:thiol-disulfide isomerase/thioredoxin